MTASLFQLQILTLCAIIACARFYIGAFQCSANLPARFALFFFSTSALFLAAVL